MNHSYNLGLNTRSNSNHSGSRSMHAVKHKCNVAVTEHDEKPLKPRKRALVACNRCRKRKIKCDGDLNNGLACSSCLSVGADECHYSRVNSISPEEAARCLVAKSGRSNVMSTGSPQLRSPYHRDEYGMEHTGFSRQPVGMDPIMNYDEQSVHYQSGYMLPNNIDYTWSNRWDPAFRPTHELYEDSLNHYNYLLPGQTPTVLPSSLPEQSPTSFPEVDRILPTPCSQPTEVADQKSFWGRDRMPMPMAYNPRIKSGESDFLFDYMPMSTTDDTVPLSATVPLSYDSEMDFHADRLSRIYSRDEGHRFLTPADYPPDAYGHNKRRKEGRSLTLMNGFPYSRTRRGEYAYKSRPHALSIHGREYHNSPPPTGPAH